MPIICCFSCFIILEFRAKIQARRPKKGPVLYSDAMAVFGASPLAGRRNRSCGVRFCGRAALPDLHGARLTPTCCGSGWHHQWLGRIERCIALRGAWRNYEGVKMRVSRAMPRNCHRCRPSPRGIRLAAPRPLHHAARRRLACRWWWRSL